MNNIIKVNNEYGYNIYNDELKVANCSDICIVKVNYLVEKVDKNSLYDVNNINDLKRSGKHNFNRLIINLSLVKNNSYYLVFLGSNYDKENNDIYNYGVEFIIENRPFIIELKDYNESLSYDKQEGKSGNIINYYINLINKKVPKWNLI